MKIVPGKSGLLVCALCTAVEALTPRSLNLNSDAEFAPQVGQPPAAFYQTRQTARDGHVEALARREQAALQSQQVALEALAQQAAKDSDETASLKSELKHVEAKEAALEKLVQRQSKELLAEKAGKLRAQAELQDQQASLHRAKIAADLAGVAKSSFSLLGIAGKSVAEFSLDALKDQLLGGAVYFVLVMIAAYLYVTWCHYPYPVLKNKPAVTREGFTFSLWEMCNFDKDAPSKEIMRDMRIPFFSCLCSPVRWADTASSAKINFLPFWTGVFLVTFLNALTAASFYVTALIYMFMAANHRQLIRRIYGMPHGTWRTYTEDCCTWMWCSCCATMQEAMEIQYVDPVNKPWQQSMVDSVVPSAFQTEKEPEGGSVERRQNTSCC